MRKREDICCNCMVVPGSFPIPLYEKVQRDCIAQKLVHADSRNPPLFIHQIWAPTMKWVMWSMTDRQTDKVSALTA